MLCQHARRAEKHIHIAWHACLITNIEIRRLINENKIAEKRLELKIRFNWRALGGRFSHYFRNQMSVGATWNLVENIFAISIWIGSFGKSKVSLNGVKTTQHQEDFRELFRSRRSTLQTNFRARFLNRTGEIPAPKVTSCMTEISWELFAQKRLPLPIQSSRSLRRWSDDREKIDVGVEIDFFYLLIHWKRRTTRDGVKPEENSYFSIIIHFWLMSCRG